MDNLKAYNLLKTVNFDLAMAKNTYKLLDGVNLSSTFETLTFVNDQVNTINLLKSSLDNTGYNFKDIIITKSFNDGNNIYDEYIVLNIIDGVINIKTFNTSYDQQGTEVTTITYDLLFQILSNYHNKFITCAVELFIAIAKQYDIEENSLVSNALKDILFDH